MFMEFIVPWLLLLLGLALLREEADDEERFDLFFPMMCDVC